MGTHFPTFTPKHDTVQIEYGVRYPNGEEQWQYSSGPLDLQFPTIDTAEGRQELQARYDDRITALNLVPSATALLTFITRQSALAYSPVEVVGDGEGDE